MNPVIIGNATLYHADCRDVLPMLTEIDVIIVDPPYMGVLDNDWDNLWKNKEEFISYISSFVDIWKNLLKFNGSLWCFAYPRMAAFIECEIAKSFNVLNHIVWNKKNGGAASRNCKEALRSFIPLSERIIFAEHYGSDNCAKGESGYQKKTNDLKGFVFEPIRNYLASEWKRAGLRFSQANDACGTVNMAARHFFRTSQWCMPTEDHYKSLQRYANNNGGEYLRRDYEDLRRDYEDLRRDYEDLRRPFSVNSSMPYSDVWSLNTSKMEGRYHPAQKPISLLNHIVLSSSRKESVILDCFMGSGTTGVSAVQQGRRFIGVEVNEAYFNIACKRIESAQRQSGLF